MRKAKRNHYENAIRLARSRNETFIRELPQLPLTAADIDWLVRQGFTVIARIVREIDPATEIDRRLRTPSLDALVREHTKPRVVTQPAIIQWSH